VKRTTNNQAYQICINTACALSLSVQRMVGRGMAQKNVGCLMELYEDVLQNSLLSCILLFLEVCLLLG
jgi:hypothetical protein